jgi:hypothetical protein
MIYGLLMRKRSKSVDDLESRYLMNKGSLERKLRLLYKTQLTHPKLLLSFLPLSFAYDASFDIASTIFSDIDYLNVLIRPVIYL